MGDAPPSQTNHQLWVNLSSLGDGNVFAVLPQLMREMLETEEAEDEDNDGQLYDLVLPSNDGWQTKIYYQLVEKQRMVDSAQFVDDQEAEDPGEGTDEIIMQTNWMEDEPLKEIKLHDWTIRPKKKLLRNVVTTVATKKQPQGDDKEQRKNIPKRQGFARITWTIGDLAKAGRLLSVPPLVTDFEDEQEMRRVYTLIYDVYRYKNALTQALNDAGFFHIYPQMEPYKAHIWLLFYDLYHRGFKKRETEVVEKAKGLFAESNLTSAEGALWCLRTKLAASVSRLRIKYNALSLSDLLPRHLRDERVTGKSANGVVTCWINTKKVRSMNSLTHEIEETFNVTESDTENDPLASENYRWDRHCPQIITFHSSLRPKLARSNLVKQHRMIVQDRSFCLGPATFGKLISQMDLRGSVVQSHVNSPRSTAYLATILSQNDKIKKLMAFSAGNRKIEYDAYFNQLGMTNVLIFSDRLIDVSPDATYMEEVVAVFATPPNSYSAVTDPIDLVCSRGGDLSMLEVLTEPDNNKGAKERVGSILDEQRKTLKFAMSRPQIQFVLYETHSELDAENKGMVQKTVKEVNKIAKLHHAVLQGKIAMPSLYTQGSATNAVTTEETVTLPSASIKTAPIVKPNESFASAQEKELNNNVLNTMSLMSLSNVDSQELLMLKNVTVPETDIFDTPDLPKLCSDTSNSSLDFLNEGCYLALLQRKVIRLDNKYMIQMAENRGLFGKDSTSTARTKGSRASRRKQNLTNKSESDSKPKYRRRLKESEMARIATPTHTFLRHCHPSEEVEKCPRCKMLMEEDDNNPKSKIYKQWWSETTRHIMALQSSITKTNKKNADQLQNKDARSKPRIDVSSVFVNKNVDEMVAKSRAISNAVPIFPKLRLTRDTRSTGDKKVQLQLPVTVVPVVLIE